MSNNISKTSSVKLLLKEWGGDLLSNSFLENVRESTDIVQLISGYVPLKQKGSSYVGLCPFHNEKSPSFSVSQDKQLFHCFGCGASGNVFSFVMQMENYDFVDAVTMLAERANIPVEQDNRNNANYEQQKKQKELVYEINKITARYFFEALDTENGKNAMEYVKGRNISASIRNKYGLGYSNRNSDDLFKYLCGQGYDIDDIVMAGVAVKRDDRYFDRFSNRLMFPIFDEYSKVVGFGGRILDDGNPKYLNSPETIVFNKSKLLYSLNYARQTKRREIVLVEGYMDVITLYQNGIQNVVAALGTAFNQEHVKVLRKYCDTIIILFDSDEAGVKATLKAIPFIIDGGLKVRVGVMNDAKDPDEYINKFGVDGMVELLNNALPHILFKIRQAKLKYNMNDPLEKIDFTNECINILKEIDNSIEVEVYAKEVAKATGIDEMTIKNELSNVTTQSTKAIQKRKNSVAVKEEKPKNVINAINSMLYTITYDSHVYNSVKDILFPKYMMDDTLSKVLEIIYEMQKNNENIIPSEIVSMFETLEEQNKVSTIYNVAVSYSDEEQRNKITTDQVKTIVRYYIDCSSNKMESVEQLMELNLLKKQVEQFKL